jgi:hypothetical protein
MILQYVVMLVLRWTKFAAVTMAAAAFLPVSYSISFMTVGKFAPLRWAWHALQKYRIGGGGYYEN